MEHTYFCRRTWPLFCGVVVICCCLLFLTRLSFAQDTESDLRERIEKLETIIQ
ncbi:MAG TPA: hypothetical protein PKM59_08355 [Thermodesulfobacteriota bacterium]|nr:hypothetical protein [Thermodesulfobacteriota bacterium]HNU72672.1 hypothetical protein [Thermodesulfobacteriota bacterium]